MTLAVGDKAPDFSRPTDSGATLTLKSLRGKWVAIYFYPEDDTDVCTAQACSFRDVWGEIKKAGVVVLGVSPDGVSSHAAFRKKFKLPFTLVADEDHSMATRYGAWGEKKLYGNTFIGMHRVTFLVDPEGRVAQVFPNVRSKGHGTRVLEAWRKLQG